MPEIIFTRLGSGRWHPFYAEIREDNILFSKEKG